MKIKPVNTEMQLNTLDERTRIAFINGINLAYNIAFKETDDRVFYDPTREQRFIKSILANVYQLAVNYNSSAIYSESKFFECINETILNDDYDDVLTLVEYIVNTFNKIFGGTYHLDLYKHFNGIFEKEYVGYRFVGDRIVPITSEEEVAELNDALKQPFDNVNKHLNKALDKISDRTVPDYENSIKESISAVEAMCEIVIGKKGTLGDALKQIEKNNTVSIHPAMKEAFLKLYGYTSDSEAGIRHAAAIGGSGASFAEARYMLVTCAAFINYLKINMSNEK
ncbi:MAG: hypothetical protein K6E98_11180 [Lachnospiraceae bacterium]|nr:hypothetical protein [Lachnospiraceae bacterium]